MAFWEDRGEKNMDGPLDLGIGAHPYSTGRTVLMRVGSGGFLV